MHVEALFIHDQDGRLVCVNEPERRFAPRFYLGCAADGVVMRSRVDLEEALVQALEALCPEVVPDADGRIPTHVSAKVESLLAEAAPIERRWSGPAYRFSPSPFEHSKAIFVTEASANLLRPYVSGWLDDLLESQPLVALVQEGRRIPLLQRSAYAPCARGGGRDRGRFPWSGLRCSGCKQVSTGCPRRWTVAPFQHVVGERRLASAGQKAWTGLLWQRHAFCLMAEHEGVT